MLLFNLDQLITVYDTPGLFNTEMNEDEIQKKYKEVLQRCESGPCVFLLVIKADRFTEEEREALEKIEQLLGDERLKKTWILFTRGDELEEENMTIQEFLDDTEPLKNLVQKYDQRYHVFNNKAKKQAGQVQRLFIKIIKSYFDINFVSETIQILKSDPQMSKAPKNTEPDAPADRRLVLVGKTGVGKSAAGNTILGQRELISVMSTRSVTSKCSEAHTTVSGRSVSVVDTPGFFDTQKKPEELMMEIARSVYISSPGPHAFLIVFPVNIRFTEHEQQIADQVEILFGEGVLKYSIILFTHGDQLEGESVEKLIEENCRLRDIVQKCGGRYHVFNNKDLNNREQVNDLLQKIDSMIEQNGGGHYSNQMYEDALRFRREEEEQREEEKRKQQEEKKEDGFMHFFSRHRRFFFWGAVVVGVAFGGAALGAFAAAKALGGAAAAKALAGAAAGAVVGGVVGGAAAGAASGKGAAKGAAAGAAVGFVAGAAVVGAVGGAYAGTAAAKALGGAAAAKALGVAVGGSAGGAAAGAVAGAVSGEGAAAGAVIGAAAGGAVAGGVIGVAVAGKTAVAKALTGAAVAKAFTGAAAAKALGGAAAAKALAGAAVGGVVGGTAAGAVSGGGAAAGAAVGAAAGAAAAGAVAGGALVASGVAKGLGIAVGGIVGGGAVGAAAGAVVKPVAKTVG